MNARIEDQTEEILDADYEEGTNIKDDQAKMEEEMLSEFGSSDEDVSWKCCIYMAGAKGEKDEWLFDCSPADLPGVRERLVKKYGTGNYRTRIYKNGKVWRYLSYRLRAEIGAVPEVQAQNAPPVTDSVTVAIQGQQVILERMLAKISEPPAQPIQNNPMEMMQTFSGMFEIIGRMIPQNATPAIDPLQMFDLFSKGVEMAKDMGGGSGETNVLDVIRDVLKSDLLGKLTQPQIPALQKPVAGPRPVVGPSPVSETAPEPLSGEPGQEFTNHDQGPDLTAPQSAQEMDPVLVGTINYMLGFVSQAAQGKNPALYADLIMDNAPEGTIQHVLETPDIENILYNADPRIAQHWMWFAALIEELRAGLLEDETADDLRHQRHDEADMLTEAVDTDKPEEIQGSSEKEIEGKIVTPDQAGPGDNVSTSPEPKTNGNANGDPDRKGRDKSDPAKNVGTGKGRKDTAKREDKSSGTGKPS